MFEVLDLFSGIGGFSLGLERTQKFRTVAFCEIDPRARAVLKKHWPQVICYDDVQTLSRARLAEGGIRPNVICGGFPCQDISFNGKGAGLSGARSGLWSEYVRLVRELRPDYVIVENVAALLVRGLERVLGDMAALGYDAEWRCLPASLYGGVQLRDRIWIVSYPASQPEGCTQSRHGDRGFGTQWEKEISTARRHAYGRGRHDRGSEPDVCRVVDGISINVDRVSMLGNSLYPKIPEAIGRAITATEERKNQWLKSCA